MQDERQKHRSSSVTSEYMSTYMKDFTGEFGHPSGSARLILNKELYVVLNADACAFQCRSPKREEELSLKRHQ
jgi:hypothetical protein